MAGGIQRRQAARVHPPQIRPPRAPELQLPEALLVVGGVFLLSVALGCWTAWQMGEGSMTALRDYLSAYLAVVGEDADAAAWGALLWRTLRLPLCATLLGLCPLGVVGLPVVVGLRGFLFSFVIASCARCAGPSGILAAFLIFGLSQAVSTGGLLLISLAGFRSARALAAGEGRRKELAGGRYLLLCLVCALLSVLAAVLGRFLAAGTAELAALWLAH